MPGRFRKPASERRQHFIREWREYRGLTQDRLAERVGISKPNLSRLENHKQSYTQDLLEALADALNCEPADLIMRNPKDENSLWSIADQLRKADPILSRQIVAVVETMLKTGT